MKLSERIFSVFILFVLFSTAMPGQQAPLGMNLGGVVDWSSQLPFVDVFRSARNWIPQQVDGGPWDTGEQLNVDSLGWIAALDSGQAAGTLMTRDLNGHYPAGTYVCLYDGEGQIRFGFDARTTSESPGRIELEVTPGNGGIYLKIVATNPADPVRNIRVLMPGFETTYQSEPFYPPFLDMIGQYRVLRFMDWMRTNNNETETWSQRTSPQHRSFAGGTGVPVEVMVELANRLQIDPWFCMPHRADDHFVREFARYVRDNLDPGLTPYLEYSNEVWNGIFSQAGYARQRGLELNLSSNEYQAQLYFYSMRSVQLFQIWQGEFGSRDFVRVLASQSANPWTGEQVMDFQDAYQNADVLATAPYFGGFLGSPSLESRVQQMSVDEVLDSCMADINRVKVRMQTNYQNAQSRGLGLVAYEAGQHLAGHGGVENNQTITDLFIAANYHPRMEDLYQAYL
ncbi:MAG TPA: hypothetical protein PLG66_20535, partial [Calditrichia bacterium]|nr:hypothetical protein [Calditrichia bacterium]